MSRIKNSTKNVQNEENLKPLEIFASEIEGHKLVITESFKMKNQNRDVQAKDFICQKINNSFYCTQELNLATCTSSNKIKDPTSSDTDRMIESLTISSTRRNSTDFFDKWSDCCTIDTGFDTNSCLINSSSDEEKELIIDEDDTCTPENCEISENQGQKAVTLDKTKIQENFLGIIAYESELMKKQVLEQASLARKVNKPKQKRQRKKNPDNYTKKTCQICNKSLRDKYAYEKHMKSVHSEVRPFECTLPDRKNPNKKCGMMFKRKDLCDDHMKRHVKSTLVCSVKNCKFNKIGFYTLTELKRHFKNKHTGPSKTLPEGFKVGHEFNRSSYE